MNNQGIWCFCSLVAYLLLCSVPHSLCFITFRIQRDWNIAENETLNTKIDQAKLSRESRQYNVSFSLEDSVGRDFKQSDFVKYLRMDSRTGAIYLKESLKGLGGQTFMVQVVGEALDLGFPPFKQEVKVYILRPGEDAGHIDHPFPPLFSSIPPNAITPTPPPNIVNNGVGPIEQSTVSPMTSTISSTQSVSSSTSRASSGANKAQGKEPINLSPKPGETGHDKSEETNVAHPDYADNGLDTSNTKNYYESHQDNNNYNRTSNSSSPNDTEDNGHTMTWVTTVPIVVVFALVPIAAAILYSLKRRNKLKKQPTKEKRKDSAGAMNSNATITSGEGDSPSALSQWVGKRAQSNRYEEWDPDSVPPQTVSRWEFPRHHLQIIGILGEGCFGQVWRCEALNIDGKEGTTTVAVKTLKESAGDRERADLLSELAVMKMLDPHPNVVRLLGSCTEKDPTFVIMEYVSMGKLQSYLRNSRAQHYYGNLHGDSSSLSSKDLTSFAHQVAKGMEYLASKGIIHRDLAARNILIDKKRVCKVADFGFARDVVANHVYERKSDGRLPIRWMAPEALYDNIFTTKTDVWSFGVLMWEIVTLGSTPYPGMAAGEVMRKVRDGYRLEKPEHCRRELYNIMFYCWAHSADDRPTFTDLVNFLGHLLYSETDYIELDRFPDHDYYNMSSLSGEKI